MLYVLLHEKDIVLISFGNGLLQEQETKKKTQQPAVFSFSESRKSRCNLWSKERRVASLQEAIVSKAARQREAAEDLSEKHRKSTGRQTKSTVDSLRKRGDEETSSARSCLSDFCQNSASNPKK